jgi:class 3 adenylate cyclase
MAACPRCGHEPPPDALFCPACGASLAADVTREERKIVSVLFADLVGFTSRSDEADPEDVRDTLQAFHACARREIEALGGTVEKFIGDAVMAVFGAPVAHSDDAELAVRAALRTVEAIQELNRERPDLDLNIRAGVNTGEALIVVGSRHELGEALAMGDVVNTASRLQSAAPPGGVAVGVETYRATRHGIRYREMGAVEAKGKRKPIRTWLALEPLVDGGNRPLSRTQIVGRSRELGIMGSIWEHATADRRPHLLTIVGPPGIGKSRLGIEFSRLVDAAGGRSFRGRCLPYGQQVGYRATAEQLRAATGIFETDSPVTAGEKLTARIAGLLPPDERTGVDPGLSLLMGMGAADNQANAQIDLFSPARRFLEGLASERPSLFVYEDIHWADQGELDLLEYLAMYMREVPAVILALARPELLEARPDWGSGGPEQTTFQLDALSAADSLSIATTILSGEGGDVDVERLVQISAGNPLFIEELAASLVEVGVGESLPTTVREAIAARLDALPAQPRATLLNASVIGKTFWRGVLETLGSGDEVDAALEVLESRDLVRREPRSQVEGDVEFSFKHILIRDVAYATLPRRVRRELHAACARYIEGVAGEDSTNLDWVLARHWREAGQEANAIPYLISAAGQADEQLALHHAVELYSSALKILPQDDARRRDLIVRRAMAYVRLNHAVISPHQVHWRRDAEEP